MEENFAEQIIPGTFIRVQAEGLIAPKGVAYGNVGIVGTAAAAAGVTNALGTTHILPSPVMPRHCGRRPLRSPPGHST